MHSGGKDMRGRIKNYTGSRRNRDVNHVVIEIDGVDSKAKASTLVGKKVEWKSPADKKLSGKITSAHGAKGAVKARFVKALPGMALGSVVSIAG
ncbi:MAG: 50S ribosomal protein L35ae [Candidatus Diapherotrites archaeon]